VHQVLPAALAREVTVRNHRIEFEDQEIDPDGLRYGAAVSDTQGRHVILREGERFAAYINPLSPAQAHLTDAQGRYVGSALRVARAPRADRDAVMRAIGAEAQRQTERMMAYRDRHAGEAVQHAEMLERNRLVLEIAEAVQGGRDPIQEEQDRAVLEREERKTEEGREEDAGVFAAVASGADEVETAPPADLAELI